MKVFGIHIDPVNIAPTNKNLVPQQPSWKPAARSFLARQIKNTRAWKMHKEKLIRMMADAPKQADKPPLYSGQSIIPPGIQLTRSLAVNMIPREIKIQKI
jgi:hypothetical protein